MATIRRHDKPCSKVTIPKGDVKEKHIYSQYEWVETDRLFVKWNGEPMNDQTPYGRLKEFCEKNDLPFYGIYSFRHFAASALISAGLDVTTVSGALGHCNSGTTLNTYSYIFRAAQARVAEAMDGAFGFLQDKKQGT